MKYLQGHFRFERSHCRCALDKHTTTYGLVRRWPPLTRCWFSFTTNSWPFQHAVALLCNGCQSDGYVQYEKPCFLMLVCTMQCQDEWSAMSGNKVRVSQTVCLILMQDYAVIGWSTNCGRRIFFLIWYHCFAFTIFNAESEDG